MATAAQAISFPATAVNRLRKHSTIGVDRIEIDVQLAPPTSSVLVHDDEVPIDGKRMRVRKLGVEQLRQPWTVS